MGAEDDVENLRRHFSAIYEGNKWGHQSGTGARSFNAIEYSAFLQSFIHNNAVRSVVDFGCGDWQFSRFIDWAGIEYVGIDVVPGLVERNQRAFGQEHVSFQLFQSIEAVPSADLLVCKDVFQHLPNALVQQYLDGLRNKFKFMLITNDIGPRAYLNQEIEPGGWRTLQFDHPPFSENAPIVLQWTVHIEGGWTRKATYLFVR